MGTNLAKSVRKAKTSRGWFGQRWSMEMSVLAVGVSAGPFGLCGASGPPEVRAGLREGGELPQLQVRTVLAVSNCLVQNWKNSFPPFSPITGQNVNMVLH